MPLTFFFSFSWRYGGHKYNIEPVAVADNVYEHPIYFIVEKIHNSEVLETDAATTFISACPALNGTDTTKSLTSIVNILKTIDDCNSSPPGHFNNHHYDIHSNTHGLRDAESETKQWNRVLTEDTSSFFKRRILSMNTHRQRVKRASAGGDDHDHHEHTLLEELTHVFHLGSMVILSILVVEVLTTSNIISIYSMLE